ncbi:MAG: hypothetical protein U9O94_05945 [Nanoarchaeota archaeon]|nr:hypothetical protein [Nanoarchaeota archaeon]
MSKIMLAKDYKDLKKELQFPVMCSEKIDGTAADIDSMEALSRQDKPYLSVPHIIQELLNIPGAVLGELHIPGMSFKDSSGAIRGHTPDDRIKLGVYDYITPLTKSMGYMERIEMLKDLIARLGLQHVFIIPYHIFTTHAEIEEYYSKIVNSSPLAEGICIRPINHLFQPGKRSWDLLRKKKEDTLDLMVTGFEEAMTPKKEPKGMVGRVIISYKGESIGAGAGKLKHSERKALWEEFKANKYVPKLAEITYKPDPSYVALREARFTRWRDDKTIPDA